mgnify:CR=1 FL=1
MKLYIITSEHNDYNQYGEYYIKAYKEFPTVEQLMSDLDIRELEANYLFNGGGRQAKEDQWYNLHIEDI